MGRDDWFRNKQWNADIEADFRQRLHRARRKFQYLRIQANYLAETHPQVALSLLDEYFSLGVEEDLAQAHVDQATALVAIGDIDGAVRAYENALKRELEFPRSITSASLNLACLIASARLEHLYDKALDVAHLNSRYHMFPIQRYQANGACALVLHEKGKRTEAIQAARLAMHAASEIGSGFRYHQNAGLVKTTDDEFGNRISELLDDE